jgi:hypothetical protein
MSETGPKPLPIATLNTGVWARAAFSDKKVKDYAEAMGESDRFPPIVVFDDGKICWLAVRRMRQASAGLGRPARQLTAAL